MIALYIKYTLFLKMTTLYNKDVKTNNIRFWKIDHVFIAEKNIEKIKKIIIESDWDLSDVMKLTVIDNKNGIGLYWYENGIDTFASDNNKEGKIARSSGNLILVGKNIGKKNETTAIQQTLNTIASDIKKKKDKGYTETKEQSTVGVFYHPMAIHKFQDKGDTLDISKCCVQPKLDGVRVLITIDPKTNDVLIYSRQLNPFIGFTELAKLLKPLLNTKGLYLDGELFKAGIQFETLVGIAKNEKEKTLNDMQIYLFDSFIVGKKEPFSERFARLKSVEPYIKVVACEPIGNQNIDNLLEKYSKDFEGLVIRDMNGIYETSLNKEIRTEHVLKYKKFFDAEFTIVGFEHGNKGKELNAIKYVLENEDGKQFSAVPNQTLEKRRELYKLYSENPKEFEKIKGKKATIRYQELTKNNIPRFCKFIGIREAI